MPSGSLAQPRPRGEGTGTAPAEAGQAALDVYASGTPANESGSMCLSVYLRETRAPLRFCNRYVGTVASPPPFLAFGTLLDASSAFSLLEAVRFANLHVTRVAATITAQSGIAEAEIAGAHAPAKVRPESLVTLRLTVRRYRGALKTIAVRVRIPRNAHGSLVARIYGAAVPPSLLPGGGSGGPGPGPGSGGGVSGPGGSGGPPQAPTSLRSLRQMFAHVGHYDGLLVTIRHHVVALYRDPTLLIAGSATVHFTVG